MIQSMNYLIGASLVALIGGALFARLMYRHGWGIAALKGMMASFFGGLLLFHLIPEAYERMGLVSLALMALGFVTVVLVERVLPGDHHGSHGGGTRFFTAEMVWVGLLLHQVTDGIGLALASSQLASDNALALIVIAHRVPVAAIVMWLYMRKGDSSGAWLRLAVMGAATVAGALGATSLGGLLESHIVNGAYAFIGGSFVHLLIHDFVDFHAHRPSDRRWEFGAFFAGILIFVVAEGMLLDPSMEAGAHAAHGAGSASVTFGPSFLMLLKATAPYLLLGLLISGLVHAFMPQQPINWLNRGNSFTQSAKGMLFGLPLPICSCGVLPLFLSLSKKGLPTAALVAFLIATPELGIDSFLVSVKLLGWQFSLVRLVAAILLPVTIAMMASAWFGKPQLEEPVSSCCKSKSADGKDSPKAWWRFAFVDLVDDIFPLVFIGLLVAALAQALWPVTSASNPFAGWDILVLGVMGIPFYVCASASVPIALVLLQHGFSVGAVLVFLFAGPATNVSTILTVNKVFGPGKGIRLALMALVTSVAFGLLVNVFYQPESLDIFELHEHHWAWWDYLTVSAIAVLAIASMWRSGPLHWISSLAGVVPGLVHHPPSERAEALPESA